MKKLFSPISPRGELHTWDVEKGKYLHEVKKGVPDHAKDVKISGDGSRVFYLDKEKIQALSIQTGEVVGEVGLELSNHQRSLTVDGLRVWVYSPQTRSLGWDFGIPGSSPVQVSNLLLPHSNQTRLWNIEQSSIRDRVTGKVLFQLTGRFAKPAHSQWDGQYLVAGYESGEVLILYFNHMFP